MINLTHAFQSAKADGPDSTQVQPSNWNAPHVLSMATARLVGRTTAGTGAAEEIALGNGLMFSGSTLALATNPIVAGNITVSGNSVLSGTLSVTGATGVGGNAAPSAQLDVQSVTKGVLFPRMTTAQRDAIASPATGLLVFNTTSAGLEVYSAGAWRTVGVALGSGGAQPYSNTLADISSSGVVVANLNADAVVTSGETLADNKSDTALPTAKAVADYVDALIPINFTFDGVPKTGTYSRSGNLVTVTMAAHGMTSGQVAQLDFTTGTATDGSYVVTVLDVNTFTVGDAASGATSGDVTRQTLLLSGRGVSSITRSAIGDYQITFSVPQPNQNYTLHVTAAKPADTTWVYWAQARSPSDVTATGIRLRTGYVSGTAAGNYNQSSDNPRVSVTVFN